MIRTAPIHFTPNTDAWRRLFTALGGTVAVDSPGWVVIRFGAGVVALHASQEGYKSGVTELWFEATDPEAAARATGGVVTAKELDGGLGVVWESRTPDGQLLGFSPLDDSSSGETGPLSVMPLWMTPAVTEGADALAKAGATRQISSNTGGWVNLAVDDGMVAVHRADEVSTVLSFEYDGDVVALHDTIQANGVEARLIDESFGRTVRVDHPDGGEEIWINERQNDLYGYREG